MGPPDAVGNILLHIQTPDQVIFTPFQNAK